jgi:hypothetical protein
LKLSKTKFKDTEIGRIPQDWEEKSISEVSNICHLGGIRDSRSLEWFISVPDGCKNPCEINISGGTGGNISYKVRL